MRKVQTWEICGTQLGPGGNMPYLDRHASGHGEKCEIGEDMRRADGEGLTVQMEFTPDER